MAAHLNYHTPEELMERFPQVTTLGWNSSKIGIFFNSSLLIGYHSGKEKKAMILESGLIELIEFANSVFHKRQVFTYPRNSESENTDSYYTPEVLMTLYPQVKMLGWNSSKIGIFFSSRLLNGYHGKDKKALILESSFIDLIEFANSITLKMQVFSFPKN